jgi:hypothetical protein
VSALAVEWVPVTLEGRFRDVQQGKVDLLCGADTVTLARREEVSFSIPVFPGGIGVLLHADSSFRLRQILTKGEAARRPLWRASPAQILEQQTFSVVADTTSESWLRERRETLKIPGCRWTLRAHPAGFERKSAFSHAILLDAAMRRRARSDRPDRHHASPRPWGSR